MKKIKKVPFKGTLFMVVPPCGIEPQPSEPESEILSIKLQGQALENHLAINPITVFYISYKDN